MSYNPHGPQAGGGGGSVLDVPHIPDGPHRAGGLGAVIHVVSRRRAIPVPEAVEAAAATDRRRRSSAGGSALSDDPRPSTPNISPPGAAPSDAAQGGDGESGETREGWRRDKFEENWRKCPRNTGSCRYLIVTILTLKVVCHLPTNSNDIFPRIGSHCFHLWTQPECCPNLK